MATVEDPIPTGHEVERQLERMLSSAVFAARPRQADVFDFIVRGAIAGQEIAEKDIRAKFFRTPPYKPYSTVARTTVNLVRKLISAYYAAQGKDDLVIIDLPRPVTGPKRKKIKQPPGKAYRPTVSYNPRNEAHKEYLVGMHLLSHCSSASNFYADVHFTSTLQIDSDHAGAHLGLATVHLRDAICRGDEKPSRKKYLLKAEDRAQAALKIAPESWHAHAIMGAIHCCRWQWRKAEEEFAAALKSDHAKTCYESWYYAAYLLAVGRTRAALELTAARAANRPDDIMALTAHGIFLYVARDYKAAFRALNDAYQASTANWLAEMFLALLHIEELDPIEYVLDQDFPPKYSRALGWMGKAREDMNSYRFPGLSLLIASLEREKDVYERLCGQFAELAQKDAYISPLDWALTYIAENDMASAIRAFGEAHADDDPLLAWLHIWPVLDPIRKRPGFRALIKRMRLPHLV